MQKWKNLTIFFVLSHLCHLEVEAAISQQKYERVVKTLVDLYRDDIKRQSNKSLRIGIVWETNILVDSANQVGPWAIISLTGRLPRHPEINSEASAIMVCHEIGHLLGGEPTMTDSAFKAWSSVEGQADYWATSQCMWKFIGKMPNKEVQNLQAEMLSPGFSKQHEKYCQDMFSDEESVKGCYQIMNGVLSLQNYFNSLPEAKDNKAQVFNRDTGIREKTLNRYPSFQCRIDTMIDGIGNQPRSACWFAGEN